MAKVLVIGSGGREHALCAAFKRSPQVDTVYVAPGNPGMEDVATCVPLSGNDFDKLIAWVKDNHVDLTFVGPEIPLCLGIVDAFQKEGLLIFGPSELAARLEGSKVFSKGIMQKYGVPTAAFGSFNEYEKAQAFLDQQALPVVIKADGLAAGKGVIIATTREEANDALSSMMQEGAFDAAGSSVVIEEYLEGEEFSLFCLVQGDLMVPLQLAQDHKKAFDGEQGPNTGGMGAYTPVTHLGPNIVEETMERIVRPTVAAMKQEGCPYTGVLYAGCMLTKEGVKTIEFNVRFGDPETEVVLPALVSDFYQVIRDVLEEKQPTLTFDGQAHLGVVLASKGYPNTYEKGSVIEGLEDVTCTVYHMGTTKKDNQWVTNGGRVLFLEAAGATLEEAKAKVEQEIQKIHCDGLFHRTDIGWQGMGKE